MRLIEQQIGPETKLTIDLEDKKLKFSLEYAGQDGGSTFSGFVKPAVLIDALEKAFPNKLSTAVLEELKAVLP